jgi:hypothetical protein
VIAVRILAPDDLEVLNERLPVWNRTEYAKRLTA